MCDREDAHEGGESVSERQVQASQADAPADAQAAIRLAKTQLHSELGDPPRLLVAVEEAMKAEVANIVDAGERGDDVIPVVQAADVVDGVVREQTKAAIRRRGCAVVRQTFPRAQAERWDAELVDYLEHNAFLQHYRGPADDFFGKLSASRPHIYPIYWSKPQIQARQDTRMAATRGFLNSLWHQNVPTGGFDGSREITYADRIRRRQPGDSSAGLSAHVDNGSVERWLVPAYQKVYRHIYSGEWRRYDPWDASYRTDVSEYASTQMCSVFTSFQGWTALSQMQPTDGVLHLVPIANAITYVLLRPLGDDVADDDLCGAEIGRVLAVSDRWHAVLTAALTPIPTMEPGDTVWWHPDVIHSVGDVSNQERWGNLMYIASAPLCAKNLAYAEKQKHAFLAGESPADFASENYEVTYQGRATLDDLTALGRTQMGMDS